MTSRSPGVKPEIMSPAGHWPQLRAAIEAGADAVYFGLRRFTARAKVGFEPEELPEAMRVLRERGVKGYVTLNTLVYDRELSEAAETIAAVAEAGADAIIVQDVAVARLARRVAPTLDVHGSTQMSITSAEGVRHAARHGVRRVVLARELSLAEIRKIRAETDVELEIFVHGALCVSYSGQCFSSEAWGGRSANRGKCAQACRLPYELIVDGTPRPLGDARYLLSPGDLSALRLVPEIVESGLSALKIEGRYKDAEYVALTTRAYREAVDAAWDGRREAPPRATELRLEQAYSRGLGPWFLSGVDHQTVVRGRAPRHRGVLAGRVVRVGASEAVVAVDPEVRKLAPLKAGDGVVFDAADRRSPGETEEGGRVYEVRVDKRGLATLTFANDAIDFSRIRSGDLLWRTHDPLVDRAAQTIAAGGSESPRRAVAVRAVAREGEPLETEWRLDGGATVIHVSSTEPLAAGRTRAVDESVLREQFGRLGETPFRLAAIELEVEGAPFAPVSLLNRVRRDAVDAMLAHLATPPSRAICDPVLALAAERLASPSPSPSSPSPAVTHSTPRLHLLVRTPEQLAAALDLAPASITLDYLDLEGVRPAVERVRERGIAARVASPRVLKPSEERLVLFLRKLDCSILVRSGGLLEALCNDPDHELVGDFSLNAANAITAATLLDLGLTRIAPTHDLNGAQVVELAAAVGGARLEVIAYHHLPVFHTEHCVFCRFLSNGTSYKDCGRPCETHRVELRDPAGRAHPVFADVGCRNTVFGAEAQEASRHLDAWRGAGILDYRLEFAHESGAEVAAVVRLFERALAGETTSRDLGRELRRVAPQGTTEGSLFVPASFPMLREEVLP